jgi:hypothetical protein
VHRLADVGGKRIHLIVTLPDPPSASQLELARTVLDSFREKVSLYDQLKL